MLIQLIIISLVSNTPPPLNKNKMEKYIIFFQRHAQRGRTLGMWQTRAYSDIQVNRTVCLTERPLDTMYVD